MFSKQLFIQWVNDSWDHHKNISKDIIHWISIFFSTKREMGTTYDLEGYVSLQTISKIRSTEANKHVNETLKD